MTEEKKFIIESQSLYYLHPSEGLGVGITSVIFIRENYELWSKAVRTALKSKNKLGFIEGALANQIQKKEKIKAS